MLDVGLERVTYRYKKSSLGVIDVTALFSRSSHTAVIGPPGAGKSTLLAILSGSLQPLSGVVKIGARAVNGLAPSRRPLFHAGALPTFPGRWSARHAVIAALQRRGLDREDRFRELDQLLTKWNLQPFADRRTDTLSHTERLSVQLAAIEAVRPAILIAERLLEKASASDAERLGDELYRTLRIIGTTVISEISRTSELGFSDLAIVLEEGKVVQSGTPWQIYDQPVSTDAAAASGMVNRIPVELHGGMVESAIGSWQARDRTFSGQGTALIRPGSLSIPEPGEESDFILSVEEARFSDGVWTIRGFVTGGIPIEVRLPSHATVHKGRLIPLRFDPAAVHIVRSEHGGLARPALQDIPSISESR